MSDWLRVTVRCVALVAVLALATAVGHCMNHTTGYYDTHPHESILP